MRSQRAYQQAFPTDRVLAVLKKDDGAHFEAQLVRRFVQLLGIYPPGTLVKLASEAVAVVTRVHAPDPYRPRVKILFGRDGTRYDTPLERNLWERTPDGEPSDSVLSPLDPTLYGDRPAQFHRCRAGLACLPGATSYTAIVTEGLRTIAVAGCGLAIGFAWHAIRTSQIPAVVAGSSRIRASPGPIRGLALDDDGGVYIGFAVAHEARQGVGFDVAFAVGFLIIAASTLVRDPRHALTVLALAFAAHAVLDVAHRPGWLPDAIAPRWYLIGCATYDVLIGALCYLPILRR